MIYYMINILFYVGCIMETMKVMTTSCKYMQTHNASQCPLVPYIVVQLEHPDDYNHDQAIVRLKITYGI